MTENNLGHELLKAAGIKVASAEEQVVAVLARDSRRVRRLTRIVVALWILTIPMAALLIMFWFIFGSFTDNTLASFNYKMEMKKIDTKEWSPEQTAIARTLHLMKEIVVAVGLIGIAIVVLGLLSLATIVLIHSARRTTLQQISVSLQTLSDQVRKMQPLPPSG